MRKPRSVTLDEVLKSLNQCNSIQYVAYRTAAKLRMLQKAFYVDKLPIDILSGILLKHQLTSSANAVRLTPAELSAILNDVFFVISQQHDTVFDADHAVSVLCRFLALVLQKEDGIELLGVKVVLTALCGSKPRDKYSYLFSQLSDHNSVITSRRLELLLQRLVTLTDFIGEGTAFGKALIPGTVASCFEGLASGALGISLEGFIDWLARDPQLLVWISTLHRLQLADSIVHDVKCSICKIAPMAGLRYRCLRCMSYNLCQQCFFTGKVSHNHKRKHQVQEYCYQSTARQSLRAFLATLGNKIRKGGWKLHYLPAEQRQSYIQEATLQLDQLEQSTRALCSSSDVSSKDIELIIAELEDHSRRLQQYADSVEATNVRAFLLSHKTMMGKQIERLRQLKQQVASRKEVTRVNVNSTPFARGLSHQLPLATPISPIASDSLTWDKYDMAGPPSLRRAIDEGSETAPRILAFDDGASSSSDSDVVTHSPGYTWLQSTREEIQNGGGAGSQVDASPEPDDIRAMQDDLDQILDRLQELLSNSISVTKDNKENGSNLNAGSIWDKL